MGTSPEEWTSAARGGQLLPSSRCVTAMGADIRPLRALFNACRTVVGGCAKKAMLLSTLPLSPAAAFFGLPAKVSSKDGSRDVLDQVLRAFNESCGDEVSWSFFAETAVPAALLAALAARATAAAEAVMTSASAAQELPGAIGPPEHALEAASAASAAAAAATAAAAPPANCATRSMALREALRKVSRELEDSFARQLCWAEATERAVEAALAQAEALNARQSLAGSGARRPRRAEATRAASPVRCAAPNDGIKSGFAAGRRHSSSEMTALAGAPCKFLPRDEMALPNRQANPGVCSARAAVHAQENWDAETRRFAGEVDCLLAELEELERRALCNMTDGDAWCAYAKWASRSQQQLHDLAAIVAQQNRGGGLNPRVSPLALYRAREAAAAVAARLRPALQASAAGMTRPL
mmetsp:Transcript_117931/g.333558  ORF Transcript_117931/g.333558 Transcript_117931/m.333558 type:complete len:411 (-) Transcript_117931:6-1238(-)